MDPHIGTEAVPRLVGDACQSHSGFGPDDMATSATLVGLTVPVPADFQPQ